MTIDSILFDAGSLFFAAWIAVITGVSLAAFGRDLLPSKAHLHPNPTGESHSADPARPSRSTAR
jgi:hypothetical protein